MRFCILSFFNKHQLSMRSVNVLFPNELTSLAESYSCYVVNWCRTLMNFQHIFFSFKPIPFDPLDRSGNRNMGNPFLHLATPNLISTMDGKLIHHPFSNLNCTPLFKYVKLQNITLINLQETFFLLILAHSFCSIGQGW